MNSELSSILFNYIVLGPVNDRHVIPQDPNAPTSRSYRYISNLSRLELPDNIGLRRNVPTFVVLHIVIGKDARQFHRVARNQSPIPILKQPQDLLFLVQ